MNRVAICTDSSALLTEVEAQSLGVDVVPVGVVLNGEPYDGGSSSLDGFYEQLRNGAVVTTSQPNPGELAAAYESAASRGADNVLSIHLDARASGTVASAEVAAREAPVPVYVVDTRTVSFGVGLCVRAAAAVAARGGSAEEARQAAARLGTMVENAFVARGGPGGRVPAAQGWALLRFRQGATSSVGQCSSVHEAVREMVRHVRASEQPISAAVGHAAPEMKAAADELTYELSRAPGVHAVERYRVGAPVGAHTGPECFGVFWWPPA